MRFTRGELKIMESIEKEIVNWNEPFEIPKLKEKRAIEEWKSRVYLWKEGSKICFSGGGKMFFYIRALFHEDKYEDMIKWIIKKRNWNQLRELKIIENREKQLRYKFKCDSIAKGFRNFENVSIIGEEI